MNSDVMNPAVQVDPAIWQTLQPEVKEVLAAGVATKKSMNHFTAVDMWNIRRRANRAGRMIRR